MFDILQEQGVIIANGDKAIWSATIEEEGWSNDLTLIKVATHKIWINAAQRPDDFAGTIRTTGQTSEKSEKAQPPSLQHNANESNENKENQIIKEHHKTTNEKQPSAIDSPVENRAPNPGTLEPLRQDCSNSQDEDDDLLAFLPTAVQEESKVETENVEKKENKPRKDKKDKPIIADSHRSEDNQNVDEVLLTTKKEQSQPTVATTIDTTSDQASLFFDWLHEGIKTGRLKTNQAKARIHHGETVQH